MEVEPRSSELESDGAATSQQNEHSSSGERTKSHDDTLPDEIVLKADYSCYCTVCDCTLSRIKDALQHASGKRHKKVCEAKKGLKRQGDGEFHDDAKKAKVEGSKEEDEEAKKMISRVFDETFHGGVVALKDNYYCKVCRCMIGNNRKNVNQHKEGKSHKMALETFKQSLLSGTIGNDIPVEDPHQPFEGDGYIEKKKNAKKKTTYYCRLCDFRTKDREVVTEHMNEEKHQLNVRIEKERELMAQQGGYQSFQNDYYGGGAKREMYPEGYYGERGVERPEQWMPFEGEQINRQELPFHNRWNQPFPQFQNRQDQPFHGHYQNDINHGMWNRHSDNVMLQPENHHLSPFVNEQMNRGHLMMPELQQAQVPSIPPIQNDPLVYMPQPQQNPTPFLPQLHPAAFPQSQQAQVSTLPQSNEPSQVTNAACGGLPGFITNESDAEVVIDVINSLLETYLKYRLQALPGSFMKLLRKSSKNEESVTRINKLSTGKTAKQIFINVQNHKSKAHSVSTPDNENLAQPDFYDRRPPKSAENESSSYDGNVRSQPRDNFQTLSKTNEIRDSYDRRSYIEDQLRKAVPARSLIGKQSEGSSLGKSRETGSSIDDVFQQYRSSNIQTKTLQSTKQTKPSVTDFSKRYTSSSNEDNFPRNESTTNDLFVRYRRSNKEDTSPQNIMRNQPSNIDFSNRYRNPGVGDSSRGVVDLFGKYRSSNSYSHT